MTGKPKYTSDRREPPESSWSGSDWSKGASSGVDIANDKLIPTDVNLSGQIGGDFATSFEGTPTGSLPNGWILADHGSRGRPHVDDARASDGSRSMKNLNRNTGSPSHSHIATALYSPTGDHAFAFDYYIAGKNNNGSADSFAFSNTEEAYSDSNNLRVHDTRTSWSLNTVQNGRNITVRDGTGDGRSNNVKLRSAIFDEWVSVSLEVEYSQNRYYVTLNETKYGPFGFLYDGSAADFPVFHSWTDNYTGWFDNIRPL